MHCIPWSRLTWDEKDRLLLPVAVADNYLHDNDSIEAPTEHPMDRIRNGSVWRMGHKQAN